MTPAEIKALAAPISDDAPSGPDLELIGDADYMRFVARIEGILPKSFANFDRGSIDFVAEFATLRALLAKSRDLRLMAFLAKLVILNRDLPAFTASVETIAALVDTLWEPLHPELLEGDAIMRTICLQTLDDMPDAVMPLQAIPLFETRRFGKGSYRSHLLGVGAIQARAGASEDEKGEEAPSAEAVKTALAEADIAQMVATRGLLVDLRNGLTRIEEIVNTKTGQPGAVKFERIKPLAQDIVLFLDEAVAARDPSLALDPSASARGAEGEGGEETTVIAGSIRSLEDATAALAASARYFTSTEPSSPVLMLIAQAEALLGKSFYQAMEALVPDLTGQAAIQIGKGTTFRLPLDRLSALSATVAGDEPSGDSDSWSSTEEAPQEEYVEEAQETSDAETQEEATASEDAGDESAGAADSSENESEAGADGDGAEAAEPVEQKADESEPRRAPAHKPSSFRALKRQDAIALLNQVAAYFRTVEPSSPVPILLEHAGGLAGRDFFGLLRDVLPAAALRVDE